MSDRECEVTYHRTDLKIHIKTKGVTNHELREILVGFWSTMQPDDRAEHIEELRHYDEYLQSPADNPDRFFSPIAQAIRAAKEASS